MPTDREYLRALAFEVATLGAWLHDLEERLTALELDREIVGPLSPSDEDTLPVIRLHRRKRPV